MSELKKYKVLRPIALSGRVEAGEVVEMDAESAANYGPGVLEAVENTAADETAKTDQGQGVKADEEAKGDAPGGDTGSDGEFKPEPQEAQSGEGASNETSSDTADETAKTDQGDQGAAAAGGTQEGA